MSRGSSISVPDDDDNLSSQESALSVPQQSGLSDLMSMGDTGMKPRKIWTNIVATTPALAAALVKAGGKADYTADDLPNNCMSVCYLMVHEIDLPDMQTGEIVRLPRIVIMDREGKSCQFVSIGVYDSLRLIISLFGAGPWEPGLPVRLVKARTRNGFNIYRLELDPKGKMPKLCGK